jgi:ATP-dependent DNA helicase RecG
MAMPGDAEAASVEHLPHQLMMSATPIPRTLGDDASTRTSTCRCIDELPPGRTPVVTRLGVGRGVATKWSSGCATAAAQGAQAYWVCPLIEESRGARTADRHRACARRSCQALAPLSVGLLHGRMPAADKAGGDGALHARRSRRCWWPRR